MSMSGVDLRFPNFPCNGEASGNFDYHSKILIESGQINSIDERIAPKNGLNTDTYEFNFLPKGNSFLSLNSIFLTCNFKITKKDGTSIKRRYTAADEQKINQKIATKFAALTDAAAAAGQAAPILDDERARLEDEAILELESGKELRTTDNVAPVSNFMNALWQNIQIKINDNPLNPASGYNYPYKSFIEILMSYDYQAKTELAGVLWIKDRPTRGEVFSDLNRGFLKRYLAINASREVQMCGPLSHDLFHANNHLSPGQKLTVILNKSKEEFSILNDKMYNEYKIHILDISLNAKRIFLKDEILDKVIKSNQIQKYTTTYTEVKTWQIPAGSTQWCERLFSNTVLPKHAIFGMVSTDAFVGKYNRNPFLFHHYSLNRLNLLINNERYPRVPLRPSFDSTQWTSLVGREYWRFFSEVGKLTFKGFLANKENFTNGHTLFPFDLTPDQCNMFHAHVKKVGDLGIEMGFKNPTPENATLVGFLTYNQVISLNPLTGKISSEIF